MSRSMMEPEFWNQSARASKRLRQDPFATHEESLTSYVFTEVRHVALDLHNSLISISAL